MKLFKPFFAVLACSLVIYSCRKGDDGPVGGKGGNSTIRAINRHHANDTSIINGKVLIKYNSSDKPSNDVYDDSVNAVWVNGKATCVFSGLKPGNYYLYGKGLDTNIAQTVVGGTPVTLPYDGIDTTLYVPVTEGD
ncbi:hypothetical protein ACTHGU_15845 [Chitinophagaceae bacterium MMS25-I14]